TGNGRVLDCKTSGPPGSCISITVMEEEKDIILCFRFTKFFMKGLISNELLYRQSKSLVDAIFAEHDYFCA
ncbi:MAG: hypothetical protein ACPH50_05215, partial [Candidatus Puniceispirillaceae bacterium]